MIQLLMFLTALVSRVAAQNASAPIPSRTGYLLGGEAWNLNASAFFLDAGQHPNASRTVNFTRTDNNTTSDWSWRIAVSDLRVPSPISSLGTENASYAGDFHITNAQFQLTWPQADGGQNQSLQEFLGAQKLIMKVTVSQFLPTKDQLENYSGSPDGNCTAVIGSDCMAALARDGASYLPYDSQFYTACSKMFPTEARGAIAGGIFPVDANATSYWPGRVQPQIPRGGPIWWYDTESYQAGNLTLYNQTLGVMNVLVLGFRYEPGVPQEDQVQLAPPTVLCQIVDRSKAVPFVVSAASSIAPGCALLFAMAFTILSALV